MPISGIPAAWWQSRKEMSVVSATGCTSANDTDVDFAFVAAVDLKLLSASGVQIYARDIDSCARAPVPQTREGAVAFYEKLLAQRHSLLRLVVCHAPRTNMLCGAAYIVLPEVPVNTTRRAIWLTSRQPTRRARSGAHVVVRANAQSEDNLADESLAEYTSLRSSPRCWATASARLSWRFPQCRESGPFRQAGQVRVYERGRSCCRLEQHIGG